MASWGRLSSFSLHRPEEAKALENGTEEEQPASPSHTDDTEATTPRSTVPGAEEVVPCLWCSLALNRRELILCTATAVRQASGAGAAYPSSLVVLDGRSAGLMHDPASCIAGTGIGRKALLTAALQAYEAGLCSWGHRPSKSSPLLPFEICLGPGSCCNAALTAALQAYEAGLCSWGYRASKSFP